MKRNQPKVEQVEMNEITTKASRIAESRTACLIDESLRIARNNNQDPFRTLAVSAYLQGVQDVLTPPAEPSGNTGEFKCARCGAVLCSEPGSDTGFRCDECGWADAFSAEPDCSAAQPATEQPTTWLCLCRLPLPRHGAETDDGYIRCVNCKRVWTKDGKPATEQPRIWRVIDCNGNGSLLPDKETAHSYASRWSGPEGSKLNPQYSTNNGETWVDEQAEREGK